MGSNPNFRLHNIIRTFIERPWGSLGQEHFAAGVKAVNDCVRKSMRIEEGRFLSIQDIMERMMANFAQVSFHLAKARLCTSHVREHDAIQGTQLRASTTLTYSTGSDLADMIASSFRSQGKCAEKGCESMATSEQRVVDRLPPKLVVFFGDSKPTGIDLDRIYNIICPYVDNTNRVSPFKITAIFHFDTNKQYFTVSWLRKGQWFKHNGMQNGGVPIEVQRADVERLLGLGPVIITAGIVLTKQSRRNE